MAAVVVVEAVAETVSDVSGCVVRNGSWTLCVICMRL